MILNSTFEKKVIVNTDTEFAGCTFTVKGISKKDQASTAIEVKGDANLTVSDCEFATTGYHAIYITTSGKVVVETVYLIVQIIIILLKVL